MPIHHDQLIDMVDKIPTFQESVHRILALTTSPDCSAKDLVQVIEHDPILTIKVLKLVNSAYFGLSQEVTSVNHSVVYVGINTIKNVAISVATTGALPKTNKAGLNMNRFWEHSLAVGVIAKLLAEHKGVGKNEQANYFVAGLLHDIGKVLFAHFIPADYQQVLQKSEVEKIPLHLAEKQLLGFDHSEIGAMIAEKWQLPTDLISSIRGHHTAVEQEQTPLSLAIYAANQAAHYLELMAQAADNGDQYALSRATDIDNSLPADVKTWLGWPLSEVSKWLSNLDEEIDKALAFIDLSDGE
ncbi:HDOD domain-containing protein [Alkalimarinus sediminis]|uniref:HDOD domain-containing protein n=1 Tax=Alkalimarinus sediminis TaxID=1632866 RepID=A0A9E8KK60_9ALTE|nr:HDOD domain-containing protein [Alkalimarinus sediminis]UZW75756.1 HDOD domain-containing protein [Alkalimarinus sediminis]